MKILYISVLVKALTFSLWFATSTNALFGDGEFGFRSSSESSSFTYKYDRIDEVKKQCGFVLKSASELKPQDSKVFSIKEETFFLNGDWVQEMGSAPILPFDDRDVSMNVSKTPLKLVSFWVMDVDPVHRPKKALFVSGLLVMEIALDTSSPYERRQSHKFYLRPGHTRLSVSFQGAYVESKENGGERVFCLLGSTVLPSRASYPDDPWRWVKDSGYNDNRPPLMQDDQILLVLHYPMKFTLTKRVIQGTMRSLNPKSNQKYFDEIHITSQLGKAAHYEFTSEEIAAKACSPNPYPDSFLNASIGIYKGAEFCRILEEASQGQAFTVVPNWKCNGTDEFCSKLGPFAPDKAIQATDGGFKEVKLYMQDIKCEQVAVQGNGSYARVAAVFRAVPPSQDPYTAAIRSGLDNMTVAAEGTWRSSSGQLCMVGCLGVANFEGGACDSRICLYIPIFFSIRQRSILVGSFSSLNKDSPLYFPLSFEKLVQLIDLWNYFRDSQPHYSYSKIDSAGIILEKNEPYSIGLVIKKSLLQFPKLSDAESYLESLTLLSEDLTLHSSAFPDPPVTPRSPGIEVQLEILSLGNLFGHYWSSQNGSATGEDTPFHAKDQYTEKQILLNVSAQISLTGKANINESMIFLEGLYDPHVGKMYLVGCRDVRASWDVLFESMDLESGLDCLIEVVVSFPPTTSRWLINPTARVSISSQRTDDDPLYFRPIKLHTLPILYRQQREDILSRRGVEGILRIITLSLAITFILSQLIYVNHNIESMPYISIVMLSVQALGYSLPLITGVEAVFKKMDSGSTEAFSNNLEKSQWLHVIDYTVKLLVLICFLLTLRIVQKVWKSRVRLLSRAPLESHCVPSDKKIFVITLLIHVLGYACVLIMHSVKAGKNSNSVGDQVSQVWVTKLEEYVGLVQDFFLLPQVIGNFIWQIDSKPLRRLYYIGVTVVRLLPHLYDYIRSPMVNPYLGEDYEFVNPNLDFYSKFGDITIPSIAVFLAILVCVQQRWSYDKLSQVLTFGRFRLLPVNSRVYKRLPSKPFETELASGSNPNGVEGTDHEIEE